MTDPDFLALEDEVLGALRDHDVVALDRLVSDDVVITTAGWLREPADDVRHARLLPAQQVPAQQVPAQQVPAQ